MKSNTVNSISKLKPLETNKGGHHRKLLDKLNSIYVQKNADYGDSFHKTFVEEGFAMSRIRLPDKLERFKTLSKTNTQQVHDESIIDTLLDLANYAIMTVMKIQGDDEVDS